MEITFRVYSSRLIGSTGQLILGFSLVESSLHRGIVFRVFRSWYLCSTGELVLGFALVAFLDPTDPVESRLHGWIDLAPTMTRTTATIQYFRPTLGRKEVL